MANLIHTCYRITDIDRSVAFYEALGFEEVGRIPIRDEAINVFMNIPGDGDMPRLELTYNYGVDSYELGTAYGHIAITADDLDATLEQLAGQGIEPEKPPYTRARGRLAPVLRARPGRLPDRADRAQRLIQRDFALASRRCERPRTARDIPSRARSAVAQGPDVYAAAIRARHRFGSAASDGRATTTGRPRRLDTSTAPSGSRRRPRTMPSTIAATRDAAVGARVGKLGHLLDHHLRVPQLHDRLDGVVLAGAAPAPALACELVDPLHRVHVRLRHRRSSIAER